MSFDVLKYRDYENNEIQNRRNFIEFLNSKAFVEVSCKEFLETLNDLKWFGFISDSNQHYDSESHEVYYTRELNRERWDELCGTMPENSSRVIAYTTDEKFSMQLSDEIMSGGLVTYDQIKAMAKSNGSGQRYFLLNLIKGVTTDMDHESLKDGGYNVAA